MSSFHNFTDDDDLGPGGPGGPAGPGGPGLPPLPSMGGAAQQVNDVTDIMIDYNDRFKAADPAMFRDQLIQLTMSVLISKSKPNPLLVGPAGVGKTRIVEEIARLIATGSPLVPPTMAKSTVWELPLSSIVAGTGIVGELESRVAAVVDFATDRKNNAVLFIDEIHLLQSNSETYRKIAQILKPALARGDMRLIGATTAQEARDLDDDPAFARRFSRVVVDELSREQTVEVLRSASASLHAHYSHAVAVADHTLVEIARIADENSRAAEHRPDSALTLMDRAMGDTVVTHRRLIAEAEAAGDQVYAAQLKAMTPVPLTKEKAHAVALRLATGIPTKVPFDEAAARDALLCIKGQDEALEEVMVAMRRDALEVFPRRRPMTWMFAGPSGVGKTEAVKVIARALTGQEPIMLNMGEYHTSHDASKLIGAGPGYVGSDSNKELPFDTLESNPYRVILLDEIEKADRTIHRLLLTALDEGWMRMASGKVVDFSKAVVIATTNAGREALGGKPAAGFSAGGSEPPRFNRQQVTSALEQAFDPEFLGRFMHLLAFRPIDESVYAEILRSAYSRERERIVSTMPRNATVLPPALPDDIVEASVRATFQRQLGARPAENEARRLIEDALMAPSAQPLLAAPAAAATPLDEEEAVPAQA